MQFTTPVRLEKYPCPIDHHSKVFLAGSCFAEHMADKLSYFQFQVTQNPWGILFHPMALLEMFRAAVSNSPDPSRIVFHEDRFHHFDAHSRLSRSERKQLEEALATGLELTRAALSKATHFVFTLGTAWVYRELDSGHVVSNCHKIPQQRFRKELLTTGEIRNAIRELSEIISAHNPEAYQVFTVSPVRHLKDGMVGNQRSKAHLIAGLHDFLDESSQGKISYFPSYEIMMDELRDYRFFGQDMIHPSEVAVDYIWERFSTHYVSQDALQVMEEVGKIRRALQHRPFHPESAAYEKHLQLLKPRILALTERFPHMEF